MLSAGWPTLSSPSDAQTEWLKKTAYPLLEESAQNGWSISALRLAIRDAGFPGPEKKTKLALPEYIPQTQEFVRLSAKFAALGSKTGESTEACTELRLLRADALRLAACLSAPEDSVLIPTHQTRVGCGEIGTGEGAASPVQSPLQIGLTRVRAGEDLNTVARDLGVKPKLLVNFRFNQALEALVRGQPFGEVCDEFRLTYPALETRLAALGPRKAGTKASKLAAKERRHDGGRQESAGSPTPVNL